MPERCPNRDAVAPRRCATMRTATVAWPDDDQLRAMQHVASRAWLLGSPINSEATVGQLAWSHRRRTDRSKWLLIYARDELGAWARLTAPEMTRISAEREELSDTTLAWQTAPEHVDLLGAILDRALEGAASVATTVRREDTQALDALGDRVTPIPTAPSSTFNVRSLESIATPLLPEGFRLATHAETDDDAGRLEVHRASWDSTTFTTEVLQSLKATWPYRADLDVLVLNPEGSPVCSVLAWFDETTGLGEFEPVGTNPQFRRMGLARAASLYALRLLRAAGATHAAVACRGDHDYPAPWKLYESVGFKRLYNDLPIRARTTS
jgi:GNAT superfamily N-acetyltransferase